MSRRVQENIVVLLLLGFFVAVLITSFGYSPRARLVPIPIAGLAILLLVFQLAWQNLRSADDLNVDLFDVLAGRDAKRPSTEEETAASEELAAPRMSEAEEWRRILISVGFVLLLVAMVMLIGPLPAISIFTFAYFTLSRHFSRLKAAAYTAVFVIGVYLVFFQILNIQLYHGYLEPFVEYLRRL